MKFKLPKDYLLSLRSYILFSALLFIFAVGFGYIFGRTFPAEVQKILERFQTILESLKEMSEIRQVFFIFLNNSLTGILAILLGVIIGLFPLLMLFSNGLMMGIMLLLSKENLSLSIFFTGVFPHGIIEIPVLIFCGAMGLKIGKMVFRKILRREGKITEEIKSALSLFLEILLPLLFLAALIEVFITQKLLLS